MEAFLLYYNGLIYMCDERTNYYLAPVEEETANVSFASVKEGESAIFNCQNQLMHKDNEFYDTEEQYQLCQEMRVLSTKDLRVINAKNKDFVFF